MNDNDLIRKLNSVGKQAFVENFLLFQKYAKGLLSRDVAINELVNLGVSNVSGAAIRVGNAKLIFDNSRVSDALELIINSNRLPSDVVQKARILINEIS